MSITRKTGGIVRKGLKKGGHGSVVIGGMSEIDISSKRDLIQDIIDEAKIKASSEINEIKEQAHAEAQLILEQAKAEVKTIEDQAYLKGYEAGKQEATIKTKEELSCIILEANNIIKSIEKEKEEILQDEEAHVYQIILLIAQKLLKRDLQLNKDIAIEFISQAINKLEHKVNINIICNNEIANNINEIKSQLIEANPGLENLNITGDTKLVVGDLILESNRERLDFRLETLLEELAKEIIK